MNWTWVKRSPEEEKKAFSSASAPGSGESNNFSATTDETTWGWGTYASNAAKRKCLPSCSLGGLSGNNFAKYPFYPSMFTKTCHVC